MRQPRVPKYCLHKGSGQAYVNIDRRPVYLGLHGSEASRQEYDRVLREYLATVKARSATAQPPALALHAADGRAVVRIEGKEFYCGKHGTPESVEKYNRLIAAWIANGRRLDGLELVLQDGADHDLTVVELLAAYMKFAVVEYAASNEAKVIVDAIKPLKRLFGHLPAREFSPKKLKLVREEMVGMGWVRTNIRRQISRIRAVFRWAEAEELVPRGMAEHLRTLRPLKLGRPDLKESDPVEPVPDERVAAVRPHLSRQVCAIIDLQLHSAARPGELVALRPIDIDTTGEVWTASPRRHKNAHRGQFRTITFGPQAQAILRQFMEGRPPEGYLFSPAEAEAERRADQRERRKTKVQPSQVLRAEESRRRVRRSAPKERYTVASYRRAIARACEIAFELPEELKPSRGDNAVQKAEKAVKRKEWRRKNVWHPHQLRHTAATKLASAFGLDNARAMLGHKTVSTTLLYAALDRKMAAEIAKKVG
jgi:integrase